MRKSRFTEEQIIAILAERPLHAIPMTFQTWDSVEVTPRRRYSSLRI
jgi:hypothetical protein